MKYFLGAALLAASVSAQSGSGCTDDDNNWYCSLVDAITYQGVGGSGSYNKVTSMDSSSGACSSQPFGYSGSVAPLDEEVSLHFRGPLNLKQFAAYSPGNANSKKVRRESHERRHAHGHAHEHLHHARKVEERQVGTWVTATINGQLASWINSYTGPPSGPTGAPASASAPASAETSAPATNDYSQPSTSANSPPESAPSSAAPASGNIGSSSGGWGRQAYYNSDSQQAEGLVFLNHEGGSGSGTFDYVYGNSLSFASSDGTAGASSPQTLQDTTLPSSAEVVIMTDSQCNGDCGYVRPNTNDVAYHGFDGAQKAFFFEFQMPSDGQQSSNPYDPVNMPAVWMLNAQIPRTLQYGQEDCSCWSSGCGEFDICEVLAPGDSRCKSTLHGNIAGGSSDYFDRPFNSPVKMAVVMYNDNIHVKQLSSDFEFPSTLDSGSLSEIVGSTMEQTPEVALFNLAGAGSG